MGLIETGLITSNDLYLWLETLPLSKKELKKLKLISIFKQIDIPIIVMVFAFPIVMLIGTLNFILFLVCVGISILNIIFSFSVLIIFGERINRILDINLINSRKTMIIRLINIFGYVIVFFETFSLLFLILFYMIYMIIINVFLTYLFTKQQNIFPAIIVHILIYLFGMLPIFYFGIEIFFAILYI